MSKIYEVNVAIKLVSWLLIEIAVVQVKAVSKGSYKLSRWLYRCVCKPSFEASINILGMVILHRHFVGGEGSYVDDCLSTPEK